MSNNTTLKLTQGYEVLRPKNDTAFPIPCNEWDVLRGQIEDLTTEPWLFQTLGAMLLGAALATIISIWTGGVSTASTTSSYVVVAWAITAACCVCGLACLYFANKERDVYRSKAATVVTQMKLIEERFEREI